MHTTEETPQWTEEEEVAVNRYMAANPIEVDAPPAPVTGPPSVGAVRILAAPGDGGAQPHVNGGSVKRPRIQAVLDAKARGYEGESCGECGAMTMVRNGACLKCVSCGSTSGCS